MADLQVYDPEKVGQYRFNPAEHLMQIKSSKGASEYLQVKHRLVWFRSLCPTGTIRTEMVHLDMDRETEEESYAWNNETRRSEKIIKRAPGIAIFRAIIDDGKGGHAEATKCEKAASFGDYIEKAETGSIGRALAMLGYGTQFVGEEFDEGHRIVDAPDEHRSQPAQRNQPKQSTEAEQDAYKKRRVVVDAKPEPIDEAPATDQQMASIRALHEHIGKSMPARSFTYAQAKALIAKMESHLHEKQAEKFEQHYEDADAISRELLAEKSA